MAAIKRFRVQNYRSVDDSLEVRVSGDVVPFIGENGAGKSNTLGALAHLSNTDQVDPTDLSHYSFTDKKERLNTPLGNIKIAEVKIEDLHEEEYPFFTPPFTFDDIDIELPPQARPNLLLGPELEARKYWLSKYANGRRVLEFPNDSSIPNLDLYEFIQQRREEFLRIVETTTISPEIKSYIGDIPEIELEELQQAQSCIEGVLFRLRWALEGDLSEHDEDRVQTLRDEFNRLANRAIELDQVDPSPEHVVPPVVDARDIEMASGPINLDELANYEEYRGLLSLADTEPNEISNITDEDAKARFDEATSELEEYINGFWDLTRDMSTEISRTFTEDRKDRFEVKYSIEDDKLQLKISEAGSPLLPVSELSSGLQWVIAFLLRVIDKVGENRRESGIFILDDVGKHLHPGAQRFLLETIRSISAGNQIIYSTHSPFLIDIQNIGSVRLVSWDPDLGTKIKEKLPRREEGEIDAWHPVREALGAEVARLPFASNQSILVEGYTEAATFPEVNTLLRSRDGFDSVDQSTNVIDFDGSKGGPLSKFLEAERLEHVILLDGDEGGSNTADRLKNTGVDPNRIYYLDNLDGLDELGSEPTLEDLFGLELYAKAAAECQPGDITHRSFQSEMENQLSDGPDLGMAAKATAHKLGNDHGYSEDDRVVSKGRFAEAAVDILYNDPESYENVLVRFELVLQNMQNKLEERLSTDTESN